MSRAAAVRQLADLAASVEVWKPRPGDRIVYRMKGPMSAGTAERIISCHAAVFPGVKAMVVEEGSLEVELERRWAGRLLALARTLVLAPRKAS